MHGNIPPRPEPPPSAENVFFAGVLVAGLAFLFLLGRPIMAWEIAQVGKGPGGPSSILRPPALWIDPRRKKGLRFSYI